MSKPKTPQRFVVTPDHGFICNVQDERGRNKVGRMLDPTVRKRNYQTGNADDLTIISCEKVRREDLTAVDSGAKRILQNTPGVTRKREWFTNAGNEYTTSAISTSHEIVKHANAPGKPGKRGANDNTVHLGI